MNPARPDPTSPLADWWLDAETMCRLTGVSEIWLHERLSLGLFPLRAAERPEPLRFDTGDLRRAQRLLALERDFDAVPELAALVVDLEEQVAALRARLRRSGLD